MLESRRVALEAITRQLIETEVIDGNQLRAIVEATVDTPLLVPGTDTERRPGRIEASRIEASRIEASRIEADKAAPGESAKG